MAAMLKSMRVATGGMGCRFGGDFFQKNVIPEIILFIKFVIKTPFLIYL